MHGFGELIKVADILNGPGGCPWDHKQTFESLRTYILEEAHEVLEAVDNNDEEELIEELGDLLYTVVFYAKVAERDKKFSMREIIGSIKDKLIRRHPHVFGEEKSKKLEDIEKNWELIKQAEKTQRKSALDGIPKTLPLLLRAQKILKRIKQKGAPLQEAAPQSEGEKLAKQILEIALIANEKDIDLESAFRHLLTAQESHFKKWELNASLH